MYRRLELRKCSRTCTKVFMPDLSTSDLLLCGTSSLLDLSTKPPLAPSASMALLVNGGCDPPPSSPLNECCEPRPIVPSFFLTTDSPVAAATPTPPSMPAATPPGGPVPPAPPAAAAAAAPSS